MNCSNILKVIRDKGKFLSNVKDINMLICIQKSYLNFQLYISILQVILPLQLF